MQQRPLQVMSDNYSMSEFSSNPNAMPKMLRGKSEYVSREREGM